MRYLADNPSHERSEKVSHGSCGGKRAKPAPAPAPTLSQMAADGAQSAGCPGGCEAVMDHRHPIQYLQYYCIQYNLCEDDLPIKGQINNSTIWMNAWKAMDVLCSNGGW